MTTHKAVPAEVQTQAINQALREKRMIYVYDDSEIDREHPWTLSTKQRSDEQALAFAYKNGKFAYSTNGGAPASAEQPTTGRAEVTPAGKQALEEPAEGTEEAGPPNGNGGGFWDEKAAGERILEIVLKGVSHLIRKAAGAIVPMNERRMELEVAEGVEPIDRLHAARREAVGRLAVLEAKYEVWDARRKMHRSGVMNELALELEKKNGKKPSEAELERLAAADERVKKLLDETEEWLAELFTVRNEVKEYDEIVNRDQAVLRLRAREREL